MRENVFSQLHYDHKKTRILVSMSSFWREKCNESNFSLKHDKKKVDQNHTIIFYLVRSWVLR
jgi:hypothetical protein